jgi:hypothetical protein
MLAGAALGAGGCGAGRKATPQELTLERADMIAVARALAAQEHSVRSEVQAAKAIWPLIANGLPASISPRTSQAIHAASERAAAFKLPALLTEREARSLTGPASGLSGTFRAFSILSARGWQLIGGAIEQIEHGTRVGARFARANVALYIESVYDAHFSIAQIGKQLPIDYKRLGGAHAFGSALTPAELSALSDAYSEADNRLYPHVRTRLGS